VTQGVRGDSFAQSSMTGGFLTGDPDAFVGDRMIRSAARIAAWEQIIIWLAPTPVLPQRLQQRQAEGVCVTTSVGEEVEVSV